MKTKERKNIMQISKRAMGEWSKNDRCAYR